MQQEFRAELYLGYQQIAVNTAQSLTVPNGCLLALVQPEGKDARWLMDGTAPTATVGYPLPVGAELQLTAAQMTKIQFIGQSPGSIINVVYFGSLG